MKTILQPLIKLKAWADRRHGPQPLAKTMRALDGWECSPLAKALLHEQHEQMDEQLVSAFGYHLLEMSSFNVSCLSQASRINHRFKLAPCEGFGGQGLADFEALPLASESVDVVILHHVLEYSPNPHQILREANRVLIPNGKLFIVAFNPFSLQGIYKILAQWLTAKDFWRRRSISSGRMMDWLQLLDCMPVSLERGFYRLPLNHSASLSRFNVWERICKALHLPFGGYYFVTARKDIGANIMGKPVWKPIKPALGLAEPIANASRTSPKLTADLNSSNSSKTLKKPLQHPNKNK